MKVAITGATGMVGRALVKALLARNDQVVAFVRDDARAAKLLGAAERVVADLESAGDWQAHLAVDAVIHLAGEPIAGRRWDARQKQLVRDSRVESARLVVEGIAALPADRRPKVLVTASGVDYYGFANRDFDDDDPVAEDAPPGDGFLSRVCHAWEAEAIAAELLGVRVVRMRTGVVLAPLADGGALTRMTPVFRRFAGGRLGSGRQWFSWIHKRDLVAAYLLALDDARVTGPINAVAPASTRNLDLTRALAHALHRPAILRVPAFALRAAVGELADYLLEGRRVVPKALDALGFHFAHPLLDEAIESSLEG